MDRQEFRIRKTDQPQDVETVLGYAAGNFFVYKGHHYWHIAHLHTNSRLIGDFARRKDALAVVEAMDSALWDFVVTPTSEQFDNLYRAWISARNLCERTDCVLRLRKENVPETSQ